MHALYLLLVDIPRATPDEYAVERVREDARAAIRDALRVDWSDADGEPSPLLVLTQEGEITPWDSDPNFWHSRFAEIPRSNRWHVALRLAIDLSMYAMGFRGYPNDWRDTKPWVHRAWFDQAPLEELVGALEREGALQISESYKQTAEAPDSRPLAYVRWKTVLIWEALFGRLVAPGQFRGIFGRPFSPSIVRSMDLRSLIRSSRPPDRFQDAIVFADIHT